MKVKQIFILIGAITIGMVVGGLLGAYIGVDMGGNASSNYTCNEVDGVTMCEEASNFVYHGLPGYEGGGLLGLHLGAAIGLGIGIFIWRKYHKASARKIG